MIGIYTVENKPVTVHNELNRILTENLREVLALHKRGINLIYTDIAKIKMDMEQELENFRLHFPYFLFFFSTMTLYFSDCELIGIIQ